MECINKKGLEEVSKVEDKLQELSNEIDKLASFILTEYPNEPGITGVSESAVDVAIRLLKVKEETPCQQEHETR